MNWIRLGALTEDDVEDCLTGRGLGLQVGPYKALISSNTGLLATPLYQLYQDYWVETGATGFFDFRIRLRKVRESFWKPWQVEFDWEGSSPFPPLALGHAHPLFEWGMNWCVATASGLQTVIHSAVVERDGLAMLLPGQPGSGKSTLCAALALDGWRLLSDELTIISQSDLLVQPVPRPISLKNASIRLIEKNFSTVEMTPPISDTHKGTIAYVRPPSLSVACAGVRVPIGYVVFPKFKNECTLGYEVLSRATALTELMEHTFNVELLGGHGFQRLADAISSAHCYAVEYPDLSSVLQWLDTVCRPQR